MSNLSHNEKVSLALQSFRGDAVGMLFPDGEEQASKIVKSLALVLKIDLSTLDVDGYHQLLKMFTTVLFSKVLAKNTDEVAVGYLMEKFSSVLESKKEAVRVFLCCDMNLRNTSFEITSKDDLTALDMFAIMRFPQHEYAEANKDAHNFNLDDEEYGLVASKPVYTVGIPGSRAYLSHLRTTSGEPITWERLGSTAVGGVAGMIDVYNTFLPDGSPYKTVYINMYGTSISTTAPKGFIFNK